jgi:Heterokaryon incompatibility protein Het-C
MAYSPSFLGLLCLIGVLYFARPAHAFGAGNIGSTSKIEGQNWRHGDIEDTLLTILMARAAGGKKFSKLDVKRVGPSSPRKEALS